MVCRNPNLSDTRFKHPGYAVQYPPSRCNFLPPIVRMGWKRVKVTEQFIGAIDEVDIHDRTASIGRDEIDASKIDRAVMISVRSRFWFLLLLNFLHSEHDDFLHYIVRNGLVQLES